jgi:Leucine-rich repeat (LRR) protein
MSTFITSKTSGSIYISVNTTTGYWKSYHNGSYNGTSNTPQIYSDSGTFEQRSARLDITVSTGEFTIVSCDVNGNVSGNVTLLNLSGCNIISFDGTGLTALTKLRIQDNQLTSFDATGMTSLIWLYLSTLDNNPPTTALLINVNVSGLVNLTKLVLSNNKLTWGGLSGLSTLSNLTWLNLDGNSLTQFDGTGLSSLLQLDLFYNQVTTSGITNLPNTLTKLNLRYNRLTTFDATSLTNLTNLRLNSNQLSSVNLSGLTQLNLLELSHNYLSSINVSGLTSLAHLNLILNRLSTIDVSGLTNLVDLLLLYNTSITSSVNDQILQQLDQNGAVGDTSANKSYFPSNGVFSSNGGRTSAGNISFNNLISKNWDLDGVDLVTIPSPIAGQAKIGIQGNWQ